MNGVCLPISRLSNPSTISTLCGRNAYSLFPFSLRGLRLALDFTTPKITLFCVSLSLRFGAGRFDSRLPSVTPGTSFSLSSKTLDLAKEWPTFADVIDSLMEVDDELAGTGAIGGVEGEHEADTSLALAMVRSSKEAYSSRPRKNEALFSRSRAFSLSASRSTGTLLFRDVCRSEMTGARLSNDARWFGAWAAAVVHNLLLPGQFLTT
jgi:hypothetical protein